MFHLRSMRRVPNFLHSSTCKNSCINRDTFDVSEEVSKCLQSGGPVVALESTIITHGMPYPDNLRTAVEVENIVRQNNAVPATIGILQGKVGIGLNEQKLEALASKKENLIKISLRDLPYALSKAFSGGTTVASTMALAHRAGIKVFVTGGIGGVHRGGETTMDVSADLIQLSRTPMTVVSAGVKSILDIGRTLEFLETHGVCVATIGHSKEFPAFFTPRSGFFSPCNVVTAREAAALIASRDELALENGILIGVPIPSCEAAQGKEIEDAINESLEEARLQKICGKEVTPFVLDRVQQLTGGASLKANVALVKNNAVIGSQIAVEMSNVSKRTSKMNGNGTKSNLPASYNLQESTKNSNSFSSRPVVIGGAGLDLNISYSSEQVLMNGSTYEGKFKTTAGGVGRNLADCLFKLKTNPFFISCIGSDDNGTTLLSKIAPMDCTGIRILPDFRTATFAVLLSGTGECLSIIGDTEIYEEITCKQIEQHKEILLRAPLVVMDGNIPLETMRYLIEICSTNNIPVWYEPTDISKAAKLLECEAWTDLVLFASPNCSELRVMHAALLGEPPQNSLLDHPTMEKCLNCSLSLMESCRRATFIVTLGPLGTLVVTRNDAKLPFPTAHILRRRPAESLPVRAIHYLPPKPDKIVSVSGAGDCFASAMVAGIIQGHSQEECVRAGQRAALLSLCSSETVPFTITERSIFQNSGGSFPQPQIILL